jgi:hypothetical protein
MLLINSPRAQLNGGTLRNHIIIATCLCLISCNFSVLLSQGVITLMEPRWPPAGWQQQRLQPRGGMGCGTGRWRIAAARIAAHHLLGVEP